MPNSSPPSATAAAESPRRVVAEVMLAAFAVGVVAVVLGMPDRALLLAGAATALGAGILIAAAGRAGMRGGLGWPNRVTLLRALIAALLLGHLLSPERREIAALLAFVAVLSDALDGWLARRLGAASSFGARFDLETDAALLLVLCLLLFVQGIAGPWVLALGAARYVFLAARALLPWLDRPLPPSERRRTAAAATMVALVLALMPSAPPAAALALAAAATGTTLVSFAIDTLWLARMRATR